MKAGRWEENEVRELVRMYPTKTIREIAQRLDRSESMIANKAHYMRLKKHDGRQRDALGRFVIEPDKPRSRARRRKVAHPEPQVMPARAVERTFTTETMPVPTCFHAIFEKLNLPFHRRYDG